MPRVIHFEVPADDPARAAEFYGTVFGWNSTRWEGEMEYWLVATGSPEQPGIDGGLEGGVGLAVGRRDALEFCTGSGSDQGILGPAIDPPRRPQ